MGLSSSQARLLNLTARMHQIEYKAAKLEAQKLQMANESRRVYDEYLVALDSTKIQIKTLNSDGSASYKDIHSYQEFINAGYAIEYNGTIFNSNGTPIKFAPTSYNMQLHAGDKLGLDWNLDGNIDEINEIDTDKLLSDVIPEHYYQYALYVETTGNSFETLCQNVYGGDAPEQPNDIMNLITNLINSGDVTIVRLKDNSETSVAIDTGLQEISDETLLRKAEAKYEADMRKIDAKDRKYDTDLAALDAERNAIKSEMETLKTVAKDNVERTFKLFS